MKLTYNAQGIITAGYSDQTILTEPYIWIPDNEAPELTVGIDTPLPTLPENFNIIHYRELRQLEYPPVEDYLDAVVKGDLNAQQDYIQKCLAVKLKYPKP